MSTKTDIAAIRRDITSNKKKPIQSLNTITEIFSQIVHQLSNDSIGAYINDIWAKYYELATSQTIAYDNYGHNKLWFDAQIRIMGDLLVELEKKIKKPKKPKKKINKNKS